MGIDVTTAVVADVAELADIAARTFPLACPPAVTPENIAAFVEENLSEDRFREYLADPDRVVLAARQDGRIVGYVMLIRDAPDKIELSKMYVLPDSHGAGASAALMTAALEKAKESAASSVWLGVNQHNHRAQRFYTKHGFAIVGTRTFRLGAGMENDYVMERPLL